MEFLHETATSSYQAGLFTSIETCGRTLLDTIDHVLDYAKINKLKKSSTSRKRGHPRGGQRKDHVGSIVGLTTEFDLATLVEEVVDAVSAGHVFRKSHQGTGPDQYGVALTGMGSVDTPPPEAKAETKPIVILDIQPRGNWFVRTQPGALRRIVMNLLGNAMKYTDVGFVSVSMQVESEADHRLKIRLQVTDSGKGMSLEFQRTRLFQPFSQEDPFSTGTGLGLSIVRQIVEALDGHISVSSTQNVGTDIEVVISLPSVDKPPENGQTLDLPKPLTDDTKIRILHPAKTALINDVALQDVDVSVLDRLQEALQAICEGWLGMNVIGESSQDPPDFVLLPVTSAAADELLEYEQGVSSSSTKAPIIALCSDTGQASEFRANMAGRLSAKGIQAMPVTQPLGPRKLAAVIEQLKEEQTRQRQRIVLGRKESDPEAVRRERDILRKAQEAQRAQEKKSRKELEQSNALPDRTKTHNSRRPGPSALVHVEAANDETHDDDPDAPTSTENMTLARLNAQNSSQRSMSAPPLGLPPAVSSSTAATPATPALLPLLPNGVGGGVPRTRVLLVDDNEINLQLLVMFMKKQGLPYATASNGLLALEAYRAAFVPTATSSPLASSSSCGPKKSSSHASACAPPTRGSGPITPTDEPISPLEMPVVWSGPRPSPPFTHVLMDLSMPVMDGLTSTRKIRAFEAEKGVEPLSTIIALTGLASAEAQEDALSAGINEFLIKPVKFGELKGLLKDSSGV